MKLRLSLSIFAAVLVVGAADLMGQERQPLDHEAYDLWNRIRGQMLNADGGWVAYRRVPGDGDATLVLRPSNGGTPTLRPRGASHEFSADGQWLIYQIDPIQAEMDQAKRDKKKPDEMPADSLGVLRVADGAAEVFSVANVTGFQLPEEASGWVAFKLDKRENPEPPETDAGAAPEAEPEPAVEPQEPEAETPSDDEAPERKKDEGTPLILRNLETGTEYRFENVMAYAFSKNGERLFYTASNKDGSADGVFEVQVASGEATAVLTGEGEYTRMALDEEGERVAFLTNRDDWDAQEPAFSLYVGGTMVVSASTDGVPEDWRINEEGRLSFSENGERLMFGTQPRPMPDPDDEDMLPEDEVKVDVWNWKDPYIQPMQLVQADDEKKRAYTAVLHLEDNRVVQLGSPQIPEVEIADEGGARYAVGTTDVPYRQMLSWDGRYSDAYLIDVETGSMRRVAEAIRGFGRPRSSPTGKYVYWWEPFEKAWYVAEAESGEAVDISAAIPVEVHNLFDDRPEPPNPAGQLVWTEDDDSVLVYDWYDIWLVDPTGHDAPRNVTEGVGRAENIRFRVAVMDPDQEGVPTNEDIVLTAFNLGTKQEGFYRDRLDRSRAPELLVMDDVNFGNPRKAKESDVVMLTRETFEEFGDLHITGVDFASLNRVTEANPQQSDYRWGTSELVQWTSNDGIPLQGILYKPDGFDPGEQYPMMVYFYERMSDRLNRYIVPAAGSSSINISFYVSRGYLVFVPDIPYENGHPGESALDAVIPGVLSVVDEGFVDRDKIGVQGHSWGGYQIAHMVTRTNLFAAAEAGAPVVNMTSAYGGIRWASGMVRQFQYERTQSRIGGSLWEKPLEYLDNSPLFQADKIQTPLLMMHNDGDGAVPWYQGIEMFTGMRRLGKPVWMLNYNGEAHGLRRKANQKDWAIRMQQFFDHYLMDAPAPVWLVEGVPATLKGKTLGLELVTSTPVTQPITDGAGGHR
jgi:dipeptidyl aminopeptidase/acylaminoacyl peptidase